MFTERLDNAGMQRANVDVRTKVCFRTRRARPAIGFFQCPAALFFWAMAASSCWAQTYNAAASFEQGFTAQMNPNGVWSYGYSSSFTSPVTLYDQTVQNGINGPNAQYWLSPQVNIGNSPSAEYNDGPAYDDGNVNFLAHEFVLVSGIGGQYSDLAFTAPAAGVYSLAASFRGDQYGIGTVVGIVVNGIALFSSNVTSEGQTVPFQATVTLAAGGTVVFSVGPGGGLQNTGLSATITYESPVTLFSFNGTDGQYPSAGLVQGTNGYLYGTTSNGGANGYGTVFKIAPSGTVTTLYSFCAQSGCIDGYGPGALLQATNGAFYGTTYGGGANAGGTVFKIAPSGALTTLYNFCAQSGCTDGKSPGALVQASNGAFYGTTVFGGANDYGTVFKITPSGTLTTLYSFCSQSGCTDGQEPAAGLVQAANGAFYGTTEAGGANDTCFGSTCGTVFKITPSGALTTLHSFDGADGLNPDAALVQATNGDLYGTTAAGGTYSGGTVFEITPSGALTTLYNFCSQGGCTDGQSPEAALVQATNGDLYGTTAGGGANDKGTVFEVTPSGTLTTLYSFCSQSACTDGYGLLGGSSRPPMVISTVQHLWRERHLRLRLWDGRQPVCGSGSVCGNTTGLRPGGRDYRDSGKRSDRRYKRHL